jgi:hypothetical protein
MVMRGMAVVGTPMRHSIAPRKLGEQSIEDGGLKDLKDNLLAQYSYIVWADAVGLTEETDKMIQEAERNCR